MTIRITDLPYVITADGVRIDQTVEIRGGMIAKITPTADGQSNRDTPVGRNDRSTGNGDLTSIDGRNLCALGGLKNSHTHAAMTLLRGYGDDMRLQEWLETRIWPAEASLTEEDIYWGTRLAALEMVKSGTTFANDMYFFYPRGYAAFRDAGIRAAVGLALFDFHDTERRRMMQNSVDKLLADYNGSEDRNERVFPTIAPHSIYTCSPDLLRWSAERAEEMGLVFHIHMSETEQEVSECLRENGVRPWQWLERIGVLNRVAGHAIAAHGIWMDETERKIAKAYGVTLAHNPGSNMKLASGVFDWKAIREENIPVMLAPDGVASNNSLDMIDEMKLAALLQKAYSNDATRLNAHEALELATGVYSNVFQRWGVDGAIQEGGPADMILVSLDHPQMTPVHNIESNLVYAANGTMVDTVICGGEILMRGRRVPGEEEVLREGTKRAKALAERVAVTHS